MTALPRPRPPHTRPTEPLEATAEFRAAQDADKELELSEDCLAGVQTLLNPKVV